MRKKSQNKIVLDYTSGHTKARRLKRLAFTSLAIAAIIALINELRGG